MNNGIMIYFPITVIVLVIASMFYVANEKKIDDPDPVNYIHYGNAVIFPENVEGLSIKKYIVASIAPGQHFEYVLTIHGTDQSIVFETREEAEKVMLEIAEECGI